MNILAIGAHPDDIEYGCGGTLLKLKKEKGANIYFFVATHGDFSSGADIRMNEQEKADEFLGIKKLYWGGFKDTQLAMGRQLIGRIEDVIRDCDPEVIFVNYPYDTHQDHRNLADATIVASRYSKKVLFYEDYTCTNYEPDIFVDIQDVLEEKVELLKIHKSQVEREYPTGLDLLESVKAVANFRGFQAKVKYAEGFKALRYLLGNL
ncbi:MAG: PIG-L deacetylase family protein [Candidatus Omnitrophota bacterium]|nr:PIG-L deacetylase family protein [Candidatus Omnitrophota bacterium]